MAIPAAPVLFTELLTRVMVPPPVLMPSAARPLLPLATAELFSVIFAAPMTLMPLPAREVLSELPSWMT